MKTKTKTKPAQSKESKTPISVAPRTSGERDTLKAAAEAAGVSLSLYILKSALTIAAEEGFHAPTVEEWEPRRKKPDIDKTGDSQMVPAIT